MKKSKKSFGLFFFSISLGTVSQLYSRCQEGQLHIMQPLPSLCPFPSIVSHPADAEDEAGLAGADAHEAEAQLPVEPVLADEGDEGEGHGGAQHVEDPSHVVHVQLAGHHLVLLVVADPCQPQGLQLLHLTWRE